MENQTPATINQSSPPTSPAPPVRPSVVTPTPPKPRFNLKTKLSSLRSNPRFKTWFPRIAILVILFILFVIFAPMIINYFKKTPAPTPTPSPTPTATPEVFHPSPYAQDEDVLAIENAIQSLENDLQIAPLREDTLRIPSLDWDISFE